MSKKISVKVENEQQYNIVMSIMRGYIPWNPVMGEHPTAVIISNKDENGKKDKIHQKGAVGCTERQKMDGYKIISFEELVSNNQYDYICDCQKFGYPVCYSCGYGCL